MIYMQDIYVTAVSAQLLTFVTDQIIYFQIYKHIV